MRAYEGFWSPHGPSCHEPLPPQRPEHLEQPEHGLYSIAHLGADAFRRLPNLPGTGKVGPGFAGDVAPSGATKRAAAADPLTEVPPPGGPMKRIRAKRLHEKTYTTPEGPLTVAIVLLEDDRVAVYEWDEEHGYLPLVAAYRPTPWEQIPDPYRQFDTSVAPPIRDFTGWNQEHTPPRSGHER